MYRPFDSDSEGYDPETEIIVTDSDNKAIFYFDRGGPFLKPLDGSWEKHRFEQVKERDKTIEQFKAELRTAKEVINRLTDAAHRVARSKMLVDHMIKEIDQNERVNAGKQASNAAMTLQAGWIEWSKKHIGALKLLLDGKKKLTEHYQTSKT